MIYKYIIYGGMEVQWKVDWGHPTNKSKYGNYTTYTSIDLIDGA